MWLQEESMPEEMKPNKSHCVLWVNTDGSILLVSVDPNYPDAYNHGKMREFLDYQLAHVPNAKIGIIVGAHKFPLLPEESFPMEDGFSLPEGLEGVRGMPSPDFVGNSFTYKYTPTEEIDGFKNNLFRILP